MGFVDCSLSGGPSWRAVRGPDLVRRQQHRDSGAYGLDPALLNMRAWNTVLSTIRSSRATRTPPHSPACHDEDTMSVNSLSLPKLDMLHQFFQESTSLAGFTVLIICTLCQRRRMAEQGSWQCMCLVCHIFVVTQQTLAYAVWEDFNVYVSCVLVCIFFPDSETQSWNFVPILYVSSVNGRCTRHACRVVLVPCFGVGAPKI
jgi:hypothetical protein